MQRCEAAQASARVPTRHAESVRHGLRIRLFILGTRFVWQKIGFYRAPFGLHEEQILQRFIVVAAEARLIAADQVERRATNR